MVFHIPFSPLPPDDADVVYGLGPDSSPRADVTPGHTLELDLGESRVFPGTTHGAWLHVPHGVDTADDVACVVFQDGTGFLDADAGLRAGIVLDNLVAAGAVPPMVGVFVDPGVLPHVDDPRARRRRNAEYDAFDSRYADFLVDEVLPRVRDVVPLTDDPARRGLCGHSSGGSAAFTAAWHRPDAFGKVLAFSASFAQMPGGNPYPRILVEEPPRPIRVLLQVGRRDLGWDEPAGSNWVAETLRTAAALAEHGYDARLVVGEGTHAPGHATALLPEALRWLWR